jgi:hypothetical protein
MTKKSTPEPTHNGLPHHITQEERQNRHSSQEYSIAPPN